MGQLAGDQLKCQICDDEVSFYSLYSRQKQFFCSSLCHQEYNSRHTDKPNLILVQVKENDEDSSEVLEDPRSHSVERSSVDSQSVDGSESISSGQSGSTGMSGRSGLSGDALLFDVVRKGTDEALEALLQGDVDVNQRNKEGVTPVMVAAGMGAAEKVRMLLDHGSDIANAVEAEGKTALHKCARWTKDTKCAELIHTKAPHLVSKQDNFLQTPLHGAAGEGNNALVEFLIYEGATVTAVDNLGRTPLHWATIQSHISTVDLLLRHNIDDVIDVSDRFQHRPLHYAVQTNRRDTAELLIGKNGHLGDSKGTGIPILIYVIKTGDRDMCALILKHCIDVNVVDDQGWTALHHAVQRGDVGICELLLSAKPNLDVAEVVEGHTPVFLAVNRKRFDLLSLLLASGSKTHCFDKKKRSPLHYACLAGSPDMVRMLLKHNKSNHQDGGRKSIDAKDTSGQTPLSIGASMCDRDCCKILLEYEAKFDEQIEARLIEMGLLPKKVKPKQPKEKMVEADVTPQANQSEAEPFFVPSMKSPRQKEEEDSTVQWRKLLENKRRIQKVLRANAVADAFSSESPYAQSHPRRDKGYLKMYKTKLNPGRLEEENLYHPPISRASNGSGERYGKSFSYSTSQVWKP